MLKSLSVFPPHNVLQVKAATQEAESATPPLTITAENVTSATTTQVTKVMAHGLVPWGAARANQRLKNADSRTNILFVYFFVLSYGRLFDFVDKTVMLLLILLLLSSRRLPTPSQSVQIPAYACRPLSRPPQHPPTSPTPAIPS